MPWRLAMASSVNHRSFPRKREIQSGSRLREAGELKKGSVR